jgi:hypothetical protein
VWLQGVFQYKGCVEGTNHTVTEAVESGSAFTRDTGDPIRLSV